MKTNFRKHKCFWFFISPLMAILAIAAGNVWLLCCGRCAFNDYLRIPTIGWLLLAANLVAGLIFFTLKHRNNTKSAGDFCRGCHLGLRDAWVFCPNCGGERCH